MATGRAALAHVTIVPSQSTAGIEDHYTVRVPTEKPVATVGVRVDVPDQMVVIDFQPKPGWTRVEDRGPDQRIIAVTWSGGSIAPGEFDEFNLEARNPKERGSISWRVVQSYADGSQVAWTGPEESDTPAPVTVIVAPGVQVPAAVTGEAAPGVASQSGSGGSDVGLFVALLAAVLALLALVLSIVGLAARRWPKQ